MDIVKGHSEMQPPNAASQLPTERGLQGSKVASLDQLPDGELLSVVVEGEPVCLANVHGTVCAFIDDCTHIGGPLSDGDLEGEVLTCPWHGAQFNVLTGKVLRGPARQNLQTYIVRVEDGAILVSLQPEIV